MKGFTYLTNTNMNIPVLVSPASLEVLPCLLQSEFSVLAEDSGSFQDFAVNISCKLKVYTPMKSQTQTGIQAKSQNPVGTTPWKLFLFSASYQL